MDRMEFTQAVTSIRVLENRLLKASTIEKMVEAKDVEEVLRILGDTEYAASVAQASKDRSYEEILTLEHIRIFKLMREISPSSEVVDLFTLKYDFHNIKVMLKEKLMGSDLDHLYIPFGSIDFKKLKSFFAAGDLKSIEPRFRKPIEYVLKDYEENKDPQRIDILVDRYYFRVLYNLALSTGVDLFIDYVRDGIDFLNITTAIRLKKQGKDVKFFKDVILFNGNIPKEDIIASLNDTLDVMINKFRYAKISPDLVRALEEFQATGHLRKIDKHMDNHLMGLNKPSKYIVFGPEPIFSYIYAKEIEIKTIRIIMVSKNNNIPPQAIRERLRDLYV